MSNSQRIGLYYPYLHFSDSWLKVAALYWPRMGRIVPPGVHLNDSRTVRTLSDELNFTVDIEPGLEAENLTNTLANALDGHYDELRNRYKVSANDSVTSNWCGPTWPEPQLMPRDRRIRDPHEQRAAARVVALHVGKGTEDLWEMLSDAGLAVQSGDWWGLHPELAWLYMCALTDKLARRNLLSPTTDRIIAHIGSLSWTDDLFVDALLGNDPKSVVAAKVGRREQISLLALSLAIPNNVEDVPVQKIIKIRQNYGADFDAFYDEVIDLANSMDGELAAITDPGVLAAYIDSEMQRRFQQPLTNLQRAMRGQGVDTTITALTTKFELPTSVAIAGGLITRHPGIAASGLLAMAIVSTVRNLQQGRRQVAPSAASYLWRIDRTLNPDRLIKRISSRVY